MKSKQHYREVLIKANHWRRCNDDDCNCEMESPKELGEAIDFAIKLMEEL